MVEQFENNYTTQLNGAIDNSVTTLTVDAAPVTMTGGFRIKIENEIILVGAVSGLTFTGCTRGAEGTTAASHGDNTAVTHILTAASLLRSAVPKGTSFPSDVATDDLFYRTDRDILYFYQGSRWVSVNLYSESMAISDVLFPNATSGAGILYLPTYYDDHEIYLEKWHTRTFIIDTVNGSNYWTYDLQWVNSSNTGTSLSVSLNNSTASTGTWLIQESSIAAALNNTAIGLRVIATKTGAPSEIYMQARVNYRLIG